MTLKKVKSDFTPIILAGGRGLRLGSITKTIPKPMIKVNGKFFIQYILDQILNLNLKEVVISIGYKSNFFLDVLGYNYKSLKINYVIEEEPLDTGGALLYSSTKITSKNLLVFNGDSFCNLDFKKFIKSFYNKKILMVLCGGIKEKRFGEVEINSKNLVTSFKEKSGNINSFTNAGIYLIKKNCLTGFSGKFSLERDFFPKFVNNSLFGFVTSNTFIDIGIPKSLKKAETFFKNF